MITKQCSLEAWIKTKDQLNKKQNDVLQAMKDLGNYATMHDVASYLCVPLNTISGRFSELRRMGKITALYKTKKDGRSITVFFLLSNNGSANSGQGYLVAIRPPIASSCPEAKNQSDDINGNHSFAD